MKFLRHTGWLTICCLVFISIALWARQTNFNAVTTSFAWLTLAGQITAIIAITLYSLDFLLATRIRVLDTMFGGINRAYRAHHIVGGLALIMLIFHPLFLSLRYIPKSWTQAGFFMLPSFDPTIFWAHNFGVLALWLTLILLLITLYIKLPYETWLKTHKYLGLAFLLVAIHSFLAPGVVFSNPLMRGYMIVLIGLALIAFAYRVIFGRVLIRQKLLTVSKLEILKVDILRITLDAPPSRAPLDYEAGQFIFICFNQEGIAPEYHPFSITSKNHDHQLEIIVKALGDFSASLRTLKVGTTARVEGAFGSFGRQISDAKSQVWIAGGVGITPFLSLAKSLNETHNIELYYVVDKISDLVEFNELLNLATASHHHFNLYVYTTVMRHEFLNAHYIAAHTQGDIKNKEILICGPPAMMQSLQNQFKQLGVPKKQLHSEEFAFL